MLPKSQVFAVSTGSLEILTPRDFSDAIGYETNEFVSVSNDKAGWTGEVESDGRTFQVDAYAFTSNRRIYRLKTETKPTARYFIIAYFFGTVHTTGNGNMGYVSDDGKFPARTEILKRIREHDPAIVSIVTNNVMEVSASDYSDFFELV